MSLKRCQKDGMRYPMHGSGDLFGSIVFYFKTQLILLYSITSIPPDRGSFRHYHLHIVVLKFKTIFFTDFDFNRQRCFNHV